ncbi:DEAD/DEAH box helicase [Corynebacterium sp. 153RC1]|uniref:ATP-dependent DNA helicase n=1 Tax=unclassified Corynebacterium TaxID=2624378 RepID=UPI00211C8421|nr:MULTISPECIES: DEAD/DEAH box helicase [unclassified Corynebacterium]MCQ9352093.1 DEAD/DEAH box helicase [Corynebacterium sp. 209RC1]MCQ9354095.1 DEAD/DEAH box helicase [Corynebacterium sp. 1222RC1]MCQ9356375.1 DEAD/DEAH box helicase [Corynebacterium sp. 122RC1]MCQ9358477.1 DEAD/DEAH box helicase [Corynebacterium sp. 142RC1]MCQ9360989.1 DEAD/DEAH box helicase [Corynebacterium sp. 153RC1]
MTTHTQHPKPFESRISPKDLSILLGQEHQPTDEQAMVIGAPLEPMLVVAGAGAGKTETMAARVVWLVANGIIHPDRVLGLTFTRKAAQQLSNRIRGRLAQLAASEGIKDLDPTGELARTLQVVAPTISTYDSFAGNIVQEFGLLAPVEPGSRLITATELYQIIDRVVRNYDQPLIENQIEINSVVTNVRDLMSNMDNHMANLEDIREETQAFIHNVENIAAESSKGTTAYAMKWLSIAQRRLELLPLVQQVNEYMEDHQLMTFGRKMSIAATLAATHPQVSQALARRFDVVLLDEYQDTSHAQRVLLRELFADVATTAVGDPMQSIYGWRGATAANLLRFQHDFTTAGEPSEKLQLLTSFRNPPEVLEVANHVSTSLLGEPGNPKRTVAPLKEGPANLKGEVQMGFFANPDEERAFVAGALAQEYHSKANQPQTQKQSNEEEPKPKAFTAAVLVRKKKHMAAIAQELQQRGVPVEIVGLGGLLGVPEVADMVAVAEMLIRPQRNHAALRILTGPAVQLGAADLMALSERARNLAGRATERRNFSENPERRLEEIIEEILEENPEAAVGLTDAIADLGEEQRYSQEGYRRLSELASKLRYLRTYSLSGSLPDLFTDIETVMGIRTEVLTRENPHSDGAVGTVHLDRFAQEVAAMANIPGMQLTSLLNYLELAANEEGGLAPGEVQVQADRVQIMTVHAAKGLEWGTVAVLHADSETYDKTQTSTWATAPQELPYALRGDLQSPDNPTGVPELGELEAETLTALKKAIEAQKAEFKRLEEDESVRLFYVAVTRAEHRLFITASSNPATKKATKPAQQLAALMDKYPGWTVARAEDEEPEQPAPVEAEFPPTYTVAGVQEVGRALEDLPALESDGGLFDRWEQEVTALIEEHEAAQAPVVEVPLSAEMTASDIVALTANPEQFARRLRRPVPFKPNTFAKRGTKFHLWLEERFGSAALLEEDELPGNTEPEEDIEALKKAYLASEWAQRTPEYVEQGFEVALGNTVVRGRMDAVFAQKGVQGQDAPEKAWLIVDWKTGQPPADAAEKRAVQLQLAVYRYAWAKLKGIDLERNPEQVQAAFYYVRYNKLVQPTNLPGERELVALLQR